MMDEQAHFAVLGALSASDPVIAETQTDWH